MIRIENINEQRLKNIDYVAKTDSIVKYNDEYMGYTIHYMYGIILGSQDF